MGTFSYVLGILVAQFAVPISLILMGAISGIVITGSGPEVAVMSVASILMASLFGLAVTVPLSLVVGVPASVLLAKYGRLTFPHILLAALLIPLVFLVFSGSISDPASYKLLWLPTVLGASIYWFYLKAAGALHVSSRQRD